MGNGKSSTRTYNYGFPTNYYTNGSGIQNLTMDWFYVTGNMKSRKDNLFNLTDEFEYDDLNRLKRSYMVTQSDIVLTYNNNGNINYKTDAGNYTYNGSKINAVSNITNQHNLVPQDEQNISYTSFFQPKILTESDKNLEYIYSHDDQRIKSVLKINNVVNTTRYYFGDYERQIKNGITSHIHYIAADPGLICIVERIGTTDNYYYTYTDHLGSILTVTNSTGTVTTRQNFDSWGRKRHPITWSYTNPPAVPDWLYRGYTGHEMVPEFGLINMNGRMYDPINGRMLSTDNYVQNPGSTQGLNRYTYAMNNPLRYTDPSGEIAIVDDILIGATIGALVGVITNGVGNTIHNQPFFQGAGKAALWGGVAGALSGGIGGLASEMLVSGSTMIEVGLFQAVAHGWAGSAVALMQGQEPFTPFAIGIGSSITGSLLQNTHWSLQVLSGGVIGGTVSELTGGNFIDGFSSGLITAGLNHAMHSLVESGGGDPPKTGDKKYENGPYGEVTVYTYNGKEWVFTRHIPGSGAIQPTDSPIDWILFAKPTQIITEYTFGTAGSYLMKQRWFRQYVFNKFPSENGYGIQFGNIIKYHNNHVKYHGPHSQIDVNLFGKWTSYRFKK